MKFSVLAVGMAADPQVLDPGSTAWMLTASALVLLMTPGLAFFYGGLVRMKSVLNIMMMSFGAMGVVGVVWALWGYGLAFGPDALGGFVGDPFTNFGLNGLTTSIGTKAAGLPDMIFVGFQATFAIITVALISGAVAERVRFGPWLLFAALWVTLVYAPIAHWVWGGGLFGPTGLIGSKISALDFAGGTVVHMNAGIAGLMLAVVLGKRLGFMKDPNIRPHNLPFVMLGAGLLWFGWFGFNAGSELAADATAALAWTNTLLATSAALLGWLLVERLRDGHATSLGAASGAVAGLVAVTPACGFIDPVGAILIGAIAGAVCALAVGLKFKIGLDDSLDVVAVHFVGGLWGTLALGFFALPSAKTGGGLFYGGGLAQFWPQILTALIVTAWSAAMTTLIGFAIHKSIGMRVSEADELSGIDVTEHAETAYELLMVGGSFHPGDPHARADAAHAQADAHAAEAEGGAARAEGEAARGRVSS
ncbi:Ammonia channel [Arthrobacter sp. Bi26]|uniref:ammonium transporter n=1 Tax=Arthrobacter sp. Bi26 TaxID=2822350 RepID=UPI001DACD231|nr:ammonium transporter [Arthrobacter sp. Bi26]CAH0285560.1 Ammonia channel [Arthrobacter sp. Bi26]